MAIGQTSRQHQSTDNQPLTNSRDVVSAFLASINNPATQQYHDDSVTNWRASQDQVDREFSVFCAGYLAGITDTTKLQLMPQSPEEASRQVWQRYQQLKQEERTGGIRQAV